MMIFSTSIANFPWNRTGTDAYNIESTLVLVIAWCRLAASHYRSHCWRVSLTGILEDNELRTSTDISKWITAKQIWKHSNSNNSIIQHANLTSVYLNEVRINKTLPSLCKNLHINIWKHFIVTKTYFFPEIIGSLLQTNLYQHWFKTIKNNNIHINL